MIVNHALAMGQGDPNPHFFIYPSFLIYLNLLLFGFFYGFGLIGGFYTSTLDFAAQILNDPTPLYLLGRTLTFFFSTTSLLTWFFFAYKYFGKITALITLFLFALMPYHAFYSHMVITDIPLAFWLILSQIFLCRALQKKTQRDWLLSAMTAGLATATKYPGFLFIFCVFFFYGVHAYLKKPPQKQIIVGIILIFLFFLGSLFLASPYVFLSPQEFWRDFSAVRNQHQGGFSPTLFYHVYILPLGIPLWILFLFGLISSLKKNQQNTLSLALFPLGYLAYLFFFMVPTERYLSAIEPSLALFGAVGIQSLTRKKSLVCLIILGLALSLISTLHQKYQFFTKDEVAQSVDAWIKTNTKSGTRIATTLNGLRTPVCIETLKERKKDLATLLFSNQTIPDGLVIQKNLASSNRIATMISVMDMKIKTAQNDCRHFLYSKTMPYLNDWDISLPSDLNEELLTVRHPDVVVIHANRLIQDPRLQTRLETEMTLSLNRFFDEGRGQEVLIFTTR